MRLIAVVLSGFQDLSGDMFLYTCVACGGLLFWAASVGPCKGNTESPRSARTSARLVGLTLGAVSGTGITGYTEHAGLDSRVVASSGCGVMAPWAVDV